MKLKEQLRQMRRDQIKDRREAFWRAKEAVEETSKSDEEWRTVHGHYQGTVGSWLFDLNAMKSAAESGADPYEQLWYEREFGPYTGLGQVREDFKSMDPENLVDVEVLDEIGLALDTVCVHALDLADQHPVVEDAWSPDEIPDTDDLDLPEEVLRG